MESVSHAPLVCLCIVTILVTWALLQSLLVQYSIHDSRYVQSWIEKREVQSEKANLTILFERYIPILLDVHRANKFKMITPIQEVSMIQTLCYLLETQLTPENTPPDTNKEIYELFFVFCAIWAFGGFLFQDQVSCRVTACQSCIHFTHKCVIIL